MKTNKTPKIYKSVNGFLKKKKTVHILQHSSNAPAQKEMLCFDRVIHEHEVLNVWLHPRLTPLLYN